MTDVLLSKRFSFPGDPSNENGFVSMERLWADVFALKLVWTDMFPSKEQWESTLNLAVD